MDPKLEQDTQDGLGPTSVQTVAPKVTKLTEDELLGPVKVTENLVKVADVDVGEEHDDLLANWIGTFGWWQVSRIVTTTTGGHIVPCAGHLLPPHGYDGERPLLANDVHEVPLLSVRPLVRARAGGPGGRHLCAGVAQRHLAHVGGQQVG